jgi:ribosomal-protein-alanine N-acetyltransferase
VPWRIDPIESARDLDEVLAIEHASFTNPWTREMYLAELANRDVSHCYLARAADGAAAGFCSFWLVLDELHINNLAVAPAFRRQGVATALLTRVLADGAARGARRATLEVRESNAEALQLYGRFGFTVASVRRRYYSHPVEDALVLWKDRLSGRDISHGS